MSSKPKKSTKSEKTDKSPKKGEKKTTKKTETKKDIESEPKPEAQKPSNSSATAKNGLANNNPEYGMLPFEAGSLFSRYDYDGDGKLNKHEFTELVRENPELLRPPRPDSFTSNPIPTEFISNRLLTHFDETSGIAISRNEVDQHQRMGNIVVPLVEAYKSRYDRLRMLLTSKLYPKREQLIILRKHLQHLSEENDANRRAIEKETMADTEKILERLRNIESMRQSNIRHQMLQLEREIQSIERVAKRVEQANIDESSVSSGIILTSANPSTAPIEPIRGPKVSGMVEVIQEFGDLSSIIDTLSFKPITVQTEFPTDDFPREISERLEVISRCDRYIHALAIKDQMLWNVIQEKNKLENLLTKEKNLCQEYAVEVSNWAQMTQIMTQKMNQQKMENEILEHNLREMMQLLRSHNIHYEF